MKHVDGYLRVSRVAGRSGESFITLDEQRRAIEAYAAAHGLTIDRWHQDLNQSGGTLERPEFQVALDRCRNGETGGLIAAKLDRLTRSTIGLGTLIEEARSGGWNLIAIDFGLDLFSPNGKLVADVLAAVAEWERRRRGDDWEAARRNAVERGIPNGRAPFGYRKRPDGRLEVHEPEAEKIREAFALRADGVPFAQVGRRFGWAHARAILSNPAYLGVARAGEHLNESAHPAIVSREQFDAAQVGRTTQPVPPGDTTRDRMLVGLARCAGCGRTLKVVRRPRADGTFAVSYYCKNVASEPCPDRAFVSAPELDAFVDEWFRRALRSEPHLVDALEAARDLERAQAEQALAETELHAYVEAASALDPILFQRGAAARQKRVDDAQRLVAELSGRVRRLPAGGSLAALWERFTPLERRAALADSIERVKVRRGASGKLNGSVRVVWRGGKTVTPRIAHDKLRARMAAAEDLHEAA